MSNVEEGGCHCGALRYRLEGGLGDVAHCHCSICRRVSGGALVTWVTLPLEGFQWLSGSPQRYVAPASCSRYFCGRCGAHVALMTTLSPQTIDVTVATLDHPERVRPNRHIWVGSRLPWLKVDDGLPAEDEEHL
ncbi:GFA family protein [Pseudomonas entomophila]|uniref:GFA family protein n=1 Tax=Pseudomonas entomophila TaxID=312306 RepID=UPI001F004BF3|nr:GFA family protein [Pseudomonas entomophila]MCG8292716.1 GFA family protein [Pseudomonas entomophila]